jgi:predicted RNA-binding protein with PUA-like domain
MEKTGSSIEPFTLLLLRWSRVMKYWLFKTEPSAYSWQDLLREPEKTACWVGVRNYQARNLLRDEVQRGDLVLIYHSVVRPQVVSGVARVVRAAYPDHFAWDRTSRYFDQRSIPEEATWVMVDVKALYGFDPPITRAELKTEPGLAGMMVLKRGTRSSVQPLLPREWEIVLALRGRNVTAVE